jgi:hypothetical protein
MSEDRDRKAYQFRVDVTNVNTIEITQENFGSEDSVVVIAPEQTDLLILWLREAAYEIRTPEPFKP